MMRALLVDIGNSRIKWGLANEAGRFSAQGVMRSSDGFDTNWCDIETPTHIAVSSVADASLDMALAEWSMRSWNYEPWFLHSDDPALGIQNGYDEPSQLGNDRMAAMLGARRLIGGDVVAVDCGTAVTIDWLDAEDRFRGGIIFPGMSLLSDVLGERAVDIKSVAATLPVPASVLGVSTGTCIASGAHFGLAGAIERVLEEIERAGGHSGNAVLPVYLTGGDGARLQPFIRYKTTYEPDLVLHGLLEALKRT